MIKKFIKNLLWGADTATSSSVVKKNKRPSGGNQPARYQVAELKIDITQISPAAQQVAEVLQDAGFSGLIVGGAVRDLILGKRPKDFDIATDARPEQVKRLFRRALLIGRRFRIVHVILQGETIEVTTFRAAPKGQGAGSKTQDDNQFGSQAEDAARRDFTVNALYLDPVSGEVADYFDGIRDIKARQLRLIGAPAQRYREDPVRILRALRFATKLGFDIEPKTAEPISEYAPLMRTIPEARLFTEFMKLITSGAALACLQALERYGLHRIIWPQLATSVVAPTAFVQRVLQATDERISDDLSVSPGFVLAGLCWHDFWTRWQQKNSQGQAPMDALFDAADEVCQARFGRFGVTRRMESDMREIWELQIRFQKTSGKAPSRLIELPRFRAGYDFLLLRAQVGDVAAELAQWWTDFYTSDESERESLLLPETPKKRRRRGGKKSSTRQAGIAETGQTETRLD